MKKITYSCDMCSCRSENPFRSGITIELPTVNYPILFTLSWNMDRCEHCIKLYLKEYISKLFQFSNKYLDKED